MCISSHLSTIKIPLYVALTPKISLSAIKTPFCVALPVISRPQADHIRHVTTADGTITGHYGMPGQMCQQVTVIYFDTLEKARRFRYSPEGVGFDDPYGDGQDSFDYNTYAGDPRLPDLIATILRNYFDIKDNSHIVAHTYCEVDYFRKDPADARPQQVKL